MTKLKKKLKSKKAPKKVEAEMTDAEFESPVKAEPKKKKKKSKKTKEAVAPEVVEDDAPPPKGHNNPPEEIEEEKPKVKKAKSKGRDSGGIAGKQLLQFIDQVERLEEEKKALADDIKDIYAHAKSTGFDVKIVRKVIAIRKKEAAEFAEEQSLIDVYRHAVGDI